MELYTSEAIKKSFTPAYYELISREAEISSSKASQIPVIVRSDHKAATGHSHVVDDSQGSHDNSYDVVVSCSAVGDDDGGE